MAGRMFWTADELVPLLIDLVVTRVGEELIKKGLVDAGGDLPEGKGFGMLLRASAGCGDLGGVSIRARPDRTIVGIGAPATEFIKPLEARMDCVVIVPEGHEVGNAVGAVCSLVTESVMVQVFLRDDKYLVFSPLSSPLQYSHLGEALASARRPPNTMCGTRSPVPGWRTSRFGWRRSRNGSPTATARKANS